MEPAGDTARVSAAEVVDLRGVDTEVTVVRDRPVFSFGVAIVFIGVSLLTISFQVARVEVGCRCNNVR